ncbi:MAG: response regulator [Desulfuromonadaceae bacterium]|nr:response regulator [Desulfuromonadaceae bacterium]
MNNADAAIVVMLVDDEEMVRECVAAYLEDEGFTVHGCASAEDALEIIVAVRPAVCISDLHLTGMNGEEFILRARALCPATSFMLHTGMLYSLSDRLREVGMTPDDVLLKPVHDLSKLVLKIKMLGAMGRES